MSTQTTPPEAMATSASRPQSVVERLILASTPAGPHVSAAVAHGAVARLRAATPWASRYVARLTGLEEAAHKVCSREPLVVDRRASLQMMNAAVGNIVGPDYEPFNSLGYGIALRTFSAHTLGIWDPVNDRRILVAPSILNVARRYSLDHKDFARWAVLRTSLWATHFVHAPHLMEYLGALATDLSDRGREFAELVILLAVLPAVELEQLTTKDLPSLGWIRRHRSGSAWLTGLAMLPHVGLSAADIDALAAHAAHFSRHILAQGALPRLLESLDTLPSSEELAHPQRWCERLGISR